MSEQTTNRVYVPRPLNVHKVPKGIWDSWNDTACAVFNELFVVMRDNPRLFLHTNVLEMPLHMWVVTAWNAAWTAADSITRR